MGDAAVDVSYRAIEPRDLRPAGALLRRLGVNVGGVTAPALGPALCREALGPGSLSLVLAESAGELAGFAAATIDTRRFWRRFLVRHPALAARVVAHRLAQKLGSLSAPRGNARAPDRVPIEAGDPPESSWHDSSPWAARVLLIAVAEEKRGLGIGRSLYRGLFQDLRRRGVQTVNARIHPSNAPSIHLHHQTGWRLQDGGHVIEATRALGEADEDGPLAPVPPKL